MWGLTGGRRATGMSDVVVLVCLWFVGLSCEAGVDARVYRAIHRGRGGAWRGGGRRSLSCRSLRGLLVQPWGRWPRVDLLFFDFLLLLLPQLLRLPPVLLALALDGRHPVTDGFGHGLVVGLAHETQHHLEGRVWCQKRHAARISALLRWVSRAQSPWQSSASGATLSWDFLFFVISIPWREHAFSNMTGLIHEELFK